MSAQSKPTSIESVRHELRPLFDRVVIKELDSDRVRRSGLVVPPGSHDPPPQQGIILAVGPGLDWWEHVGVTMPVQPGDHVVFHASAGASKPCCQGSRLSWDTRGPRTRSSCGESSLWTRLRRALPRLTDRAH